MMLLKFTPEDVRGALRGVLREEVPGEGYPRVNDSTEHLQRLRMLWYVTPAKVFAKTELPPIIAIGGAAIYYYRQ
jgi:hypothetical protein